MFGSGGSHCEFKFITKARLWPNRLYYVSLTILYPFLLHTAGQSLIQPFLEQFEHNLGQKSFIKRLFQPTVGPISALGPNQPQLIGLYWPWLKGAKLDSKIGLYFTHRNGPIFRAKTDLSDLEWSWVEQRFIPELFSPSKFQDFSRCTKPS